MHRIEPCAPYLPRRASDTNKYDYGRVLIVGGCVGYTGAPTLCAHAALRCGAGLVSVGVPEAIYAITAVKNDAAQRRGSIEAEIEQYRALKETATEMYKMQTRCRSCSSGCAGAMCACSAPAWGEMPRSRRWCRLSFCARRPRSCSTPTRSLLSRRM